MAGSPGVINADGKGSLGLNMCHHQWQEKETSAPTPLTKPDALPPPPTKPEALTLLAKIIAKPEKLEDIPIHETTVTETEEDTK